MKSTINLHFRHMSLCLLMVYTCRSLQWRHTTLLYGPWGVSGITFGFMHISCLVHGLHGVWCFVSGMGQWVCHSGPQGSYRCLKRVLLFTPLTLMCVCGCGRVHTKSSLSVFTTLGSLAGQTLTRGEWESGQRDYTLGTAVTTLLCGCSVVKLNFSIFTRPHLGFG